MKKLAVALAVVSIGISVVFLLIKQHNPLNSLLFEAVRENDVVRTLELIKGGASLSAKDTAGQNPLHSAVYHGHYEVAQILIVNGADINARDNRGGTAVHWAVLNVDSRNLNLLIKSGAKVDEVDKFDMTPLNWAVAENKYNNVKILLAAGANPKRKNSKGKTPYDYAKRKGNKGIIDLFEKGVLSIKR